MDQFALATATTVEIAVPVLADSEDEAPETFTVSVSASLDGTTVEATATGTILDGSVLPPAPRIDTAPVAADWPLLPAGLDGTSEFRLLFVTSATRDATSTDIDAYNRFVQGRAAAGHAALGRYAPGFRAVGRVVGTDAAANTGLPASTGDTPVPVYWLNGGRIVADSAELLSGSWETQATRDETGGAGRASCPLGGALCVFTGQDKNALDGWVLGGGTNPLLASPGPWVTVGRPSVDGGGVDAEVVASPGQTMPFYGLSPVFQAQAGLALPVVSVADASAEESAGEMHFVVTLDRAPTTDLTVGYATADGSALVGADYEAAAGRLRFTAAETAKTVTVTLVTDGDAEGSEYFRLTLGEGQNVRIAEAGATATGRISDRDELPGVRLLDPHRDAVEGEGVFAVFGVALEGPASGAVTLAYETVEGSAGATDYTALSGTLTLSAGTGLASIPVALLDDAEHENDESFLLAVSEVRGARLVGGATARAMIFDDDAPHDEPARALHGVASDWSLIPAGLGVGDEFHLLFVTSGERGAGSADIGDYNDFVRGHAAAGHEDIGASASHFRAVAGTANWPEGVTVFANTGTEQARTTGQPIYWLGGARIAPHYAAFYDQGAKHTGNAHWESRAPVDESGETVDGNCTVASDSHVCVNTGFLPRYPMGGHYVTAGVPTSEPVDGSETGLAHPALSPTRAHHLHLPLYGLSPVYRVMPQTHVFPTLSVADATATEPASAVAFTVSLSAATTLDVAVAYETAPGTARGSADTPSGPDYATRTGTLVVPAGHTTGTIRVALEDDVLDEPDETFTVTLRHPSNATLDDASATGTITDDDPLPTLTATAAKARFAESDSIEVDVRLSDPSGYEVTVQYATVAGSATADEDYLATTGTLTFRAGETNDTVRVAVVNDHRHEPGGDETLLLRFQSATQAQFAGPAETIEVRISIQDDDAAQLPLASITAASPAVAEGGTVDVTVALSRAPASAVVIPVELRYAGGATGSDVSVASSALRRTFTPGGALSQTFEVGATDDTHNDDGESIRLRLRLPAGVARGDPTELTIYIADDDGAGVSVSDDAIQVPEGGSAPYRVALLASPATADGDVVVTLGGTSGSDLTVSPTALTFDASNWQTAQTVVVQAADDADALVDTPVPLTHVAAGPGYPGVRGPVVVATITEDDRAQVSWSAAAVTAGEASTTASFVVELSARSTAVVSVDYRTSDGTAQAPGDYDAVSGTAQFDHLTTEKTIRVPIRDDAVDEDESETFSVTLSNSVNADLVAPQVTTGQIEDDDLPMVRASFAAEVYTVTEGGTETVTVNLDRAPERALSLALTAAELGETQRLDYHVPEALTFDADQESASFVFFAVDDFDNDDGERLVLRLTGLPPGVTVGTPETATVHIDDNDEPAVVLSHPTVRVAEGGQSEYTVALATTPSGPVAVTLDLPADSVVDVAPRSLSFTATDWATGQTVTLTVPNDDDLAEPPPMVLAHVAVGSDYGGVTAALTVTVGGNDYATVSVADSAADEGSGYLAFEVALDRPAGGDVTVDYATVGSVASAPADYEHVDGRLRFASGVSRQTVRVPLVDDDVDEPDETFTLALSEPRNAVFGDQRETVSAVGTIRDDDHPVVAVSFAANAYATEEGASAALLVQVDKDPGRTLGVPVAARPGAGVSAADYRAPDSVTFVAGGPLTQTFAVTAVDDMDDEADEAVTFRLSPGTGATHGAIAEAVVHLVDNDGRGIVLSNRAPRVAEGGTLTYTVALASRPSADVVVTLAVTAGADLSVTPGALNFARDAFATAQSVTLAAAADQDAVPDPPVEIGHTAVGGDYDGESAAVTATIVEAHRPTLTVADASAAEGAGRIEFEVSLDVAAAGVVTVDYATSGGTATAPRDYLDTRGTLRFLPGVTTRKVHVQVRDDGVDEAVESETFTLHFGDLRNAAFPDGADSLSAVGTIEDDDLPRVEVAFGAAVAAVVEGGVAASVEVRLDKEPERSLEISLVVSGTASSSDYRIVPQTVEFAVGGALVRTVAITAPDDDYDDGGETVEIALPPTLPPGVFAGQPDRVAVHLTDDDRRGIEVMPQPLHVDAGREPTW